MNVIITAVREIRKKYMLLRDPVGYYRKQGAKIGERCEIRSAKFSSEPYLISIGDHVRINAGVEFVTHDGGAWVLRELSKIENKEEITLFGTITIGNNCHIGSNAILMPNVKIGDNCIIGCGAVVTKSIPDNSIAVGIPARVIETIEEYEAKHINDFCFTKSMNPAESKQYLTDKYTTEKKNGV